MKYFVITFLLFITTLSFAQSSSGFDSFDNSYFDTESTRSNEIRFNGLDLLISPAINISYERILNASSGFGASLFFDFGDDVYDKDFSITPFYRFYFLSQEEFGASGFFGEVFASFSSGKNDNFIGSTSDEKFFDISLGLGGGKKWVNQNGFTFELGIGAGRFLLDNSNEDVDVMLNVSIGKRF
ncbi:MAG: hypothetical protein P8L72_03085 [Flavobacteriaceae bacterium]|nr:hypothetical protein [Flavobacteriaceae bacterium]MDG2314352.1 hypothetical protein [Flavobacteriaceae bacterium]